MLLKRHNLTFLSFLFFTCSAIAGTHHTASYSTTELQIFHSPRQKHQGWLNFSVARGTTSSGFDKFSDNGPLFAGLGSVKFADLVKNYHSLKQAPKTKSFLEDVCLSEDFSFEDRNNLFAGGKAEILEFNLLASVPLNDNFYGTLELPIRSCKLNNLGFVSSSGASTEFAKLVNREIDPVLEEQGFEPLANGVTQNGISDIILSLGWSEKFIYHEKTNPAMSAGAAIRCGIILPTSTIIGFDKNYLYNIPLGNNGSFGIKLQMDGQIEFKPYICIVGSVESKIFLRKQETQELKVAESIQGIMFGPKGYVTYDNGHEWKVGTALKAGSTEMGAFVFAGYSYSSKEVTRIELSDREIHANKEFKVIKDVKTLTAATVAAAPTENIKLTDVLINTQPQFERQYAHALHIGLQISPTLYSTDSADEADAEMPNPIIEVAYNYPLFGKNYLAMPIVSGSIGFGIRLKF